MQNLLKTRVCLGFLAAKGGSSEELVVIVLFWATAKWRAWTSEFKTPAAWLESTCCFHCVQKPVDRLRLQSFAPTSAQWLYQNFQAWCLLVAELRCLWAGTLRTSILPGPRLSKEACIQRQRSACGCPWLAKLRPATNNRNLLTTPRQSVHTRTEAPDKAAKCRTTATAESSALNAFWTRPGNQADASKDGAEKVHWLENPGARTAHHAATRSSGWACWRQLPSVKTSFQPTRAKVAIWAGMSAGSAFNSWSQGNWVGGCSPQPCSARAGGNGPYTHWPWGHVGHARFACRYKSKTYATRSLVHHTTCKALFLHPNVPEHRK